jgi:preprotein translocase subunit SecD
LRKLKQRNKKIGELFESTNPPLIGKFLKDAQGTPTQGQNWEVAIRFEQKGGELFAQLSKELAGTGRSIGIFLDNAVISYPVVGPEHAATGITGGSAVITGNFTAAEASDLGVQLRGGALPVPVAIVENRTVGATLGKDSIQSSIYAGIGGLTLVLIFMVAYYRLPGALADISLIIYALLSWAAFGLLQVTMTLPGIAGFVLSIGMAVDANVLIFERTREELQAGKTLFRSVESGFFRAFSSILDGNVTTWVACFFLFIFGSGLIKGFAVTLSIGVLISMFTAITCTRTLMFVAISIPAFKKPEYFCPNLSASKKVEVAK